MERKIGPRMDTKKNWHHRWTQSSARLVVVLALFLWYSICGAQTPSPTPPAMEVVFLGTGGPRAAGGAASCTSSSFTGMLGSWLIRPVLK